MDVEPHIRHLYGPEKVDYAEDELVVTCMVRDGQSYIKSFLEHYFFVLGVKHIILLDNGSIDATVPTARSYENVTILQTDLSWGHRNLLKRYLVTRFGRGRWMLHVDIDELFDYPYSDTIDLRSFLHYLAENSYTAVVAQMLDMFPAKPELRATNIRDEPLKELHRFYDTSNIRKQNYYRFRQVTNTVASEEMEVYRDGIHHTLFGHNMLLTKHPLLFVNEEIEPMIPAGHWVSRAHVADITCVLFHYKFTGDFYERAVRAVKEDRSLKYERFFETLERNPELQVKRETAQELGDVNELVDNQFLVVSADYLAWVDAEEKKNMPDDALEDVESRRLVKTFSSFSLRARTQARTVRVLERQIEILERQIEILERRGKRKEDRLGDERRRLKEELDQERQGFEDLEKRNQSLERQIQSIQNSRSWRLLGRLGRIRARILGKR